MPTLHITYGIIGNSAALFSICQDQVGTHGQLQAGLTGGVQEENIEASAVWPGRHGRVSLYRLDTLLMSCLLSSLCPSVVAVCSVEWI